MFIILLLKLLTIFLHFCSYRKIENGSPPSPVLQKNPQNEVAVQPNESEKGINFHKKI